MTTTPLSRLLLAVPSFAIVALAPPPERAHAYDDAGIAWEERPLALRGHFSAGGPVGIVGATIDYSIVPELGVSVGAGRNLDGLQVTLALDLRYPISRVLALGLALGGSTGPYTTSTCPVLSFGDCYDGSYRWDHALWLNTAITFEMRLLSGLTAGPYVGYGRLLNFHANSCAEALGAESCASRADFDDEFPFAGTQLLFVGAGVGYAFEL